MVSACVDVNRMTLSYKVAEMCVFTIPDRQWCEKGIAVSVLWDERFAAAGFYNPMIKNHPAAAAAATAAVAAL